MHTTTLSGIQNSLDFISAARPVQELLRALTAPYVPPKRTYGMTRLVATDHEGVVGDGKTEISAAINEVIKHLPRNGGTVYLPAGDYLVDPVKSIIPISNMCLELHPDANLIAQTNDAIRYGVIALRGVSDVEIVGGAIRGDRDTHQYTPQRTAALSTHEWGHGIQVYGSSKLTIRDMLLTDLTGDGMSLSALNVDEDPELEPCDDIVVVGVRSIRNRRQGISVGRVTNCLIRRCELAYTSGTSPECGIDIEPESGGEARNIQILESWIHDNDKNGLLALKRSDVTSPVGDIMAGRNLIENNTNGIYSANADGMDVFGNVIIRNRATGFHVGTGTKKVHINENLFGFNYRRTGEGVDRADQVLYGWNSKLEKDILVRNDPLENAYGRNFYI